MATYTDNYNLVKPTMAETADIRTINGNMDSIDNILHASQVSLAPAYDANSTYNTGDVVMYELLMYECLDDDVTGVWDATKWQRTTAGQHGGGGGADVEANPSGTATAGDLTKLRVGQDIYSVPSGGGGGGSSDGVIEGLDYDRADSLNLPDFTGYTYTPTEEGVIMLKGYGAVGGVTAESTGNDTLFLAVLGDTWTNPWIPVSKGTEYTLKRMAQSSSFPSGSWLKFIPWKRGVFLAPMIYSTEEREVGVWVDDKPLYQKTIIANYTSGVSSGAHVVENIADIKIVNGFGSYVESSGYIYTMPYAEGTGTSFYYYDGDVVFSTGGSVSFASGTLYLTIQYTKDLDTAGSGSYGSLGVPMEHYDSTEKVVGTWLGSTLYEKTINVTGLSCTTSDYFGSYSGSLDLSGYIGNFEDVFVDLNMSYLITSGGVKERFVLTQAPPNSTSIYLFTCASRSNVSAVLTIRYTKSST